ncbi:MULTISPECIES: mechanosensitive ion channel family protein [unclassified Saccharicrinis]|uniref:mechanosensitive ion channel family protein n=1 Tax=unclassified Saccharicrinis TaxID=2646859 RepID=UPI003D35546B
MNTIINEVKELLNNLISEIILHIPDLLSAILVLFASLVLARVVRKLIKRFILYLHHFINDKLNNKRVNVDLQGSANFIATTFYWIILLFSVAIITQILELTFLTKWFDSLINYLPNVIAALIIVFLGFIAGKLTKDLIISLTAHTVVTNGKHLGGLTKYCIVAISVIVAINQLGIDIAFLTNIISIILGALLFGAALAFGLGAKTSVSNILSSYYIQKTYKTGNTVQIGEVEGVIIEITATSVTLDTKSGKVVIPAKYFNETKTVIKDMTHEN